MAGAEPAVMLISDRRRLGRPLAAWAADGAAAGADFVQLREKDMADGDLLRAARAMVAAVAAVAGSRTRLLVNGRPDVAVLAGAHGVQLPAAGLPVARVRAEYPELVVGASTHSPDAAAQAARDGAHLVLLGPVLRTPGKEDRALGVDALRRAAASCAVPVYAVGGVDPGSAARLRSAGAAGLAAIRCFTGSDVAAVVAALKAC